MPDMGGGDLGIMGIVGTVASTAGHRDMVDDHDDAWTFNLFARVKKYSEESEEQRNRFGQHGGICV